MALKSTSATGVDLNVNVLTMGNWPTYPVCDVQLPVDMVEYQQVCLSIFFCQFDDIILNKNFLIIKKIDFNYKKAI